MEINDLDFEGHCWDENRTKMEHDRRIGLNLERRPSCQTPLQCGYACHPLLPGSLMPEITAAPKKKTAFTAPLCPSAELARIVGAEPLPRTEATKKLWDYIKAHDLQNPANKRNILCDDALKAVMGKPEVTMFEMTRLIGKHLTAV